MAESPRRSTPDAAQKSTAGKNVYCIVLTQNVDSANYSISRNKLSSIHPLVDKAAFHDIVTTVDVEKIADDFTIDWEKYCNMMRDDAVNETSDPVASGICENVSRGKGYC